MIDYILKTVPLDDIELGVRYRKDYGDLDEMCYSIKKNGQISPITLGLNPDRASSKPYILAAGGRRFSAFTKMATVDGKFKQIDAKIYNKILSDLEIRSIELCENIHRKDFDYAEKLKITAEVQRLQVMIHGEKVSRDPDAPGWSQADTAKLLGKSASSIAADLKLAKAIEQIPELANCKNKNEAFKKLHNIESSIINSQLSNNYKKALKNEDSIQSKLINAYILGDFFEVVKKIPDNTVDFCEIDPPYAINLNDLKKKEYNSSVKTYNEIDVSEYIDFMNKTFKQCYRIMKPDSWLICWFAPEPWFNTIYELLTSNDFKTNRMVGVWNKNVGQNMSPTTRLTNVYEVFFYARKGSATLNKPGSNNMFNFLPVPASEKYHPTQRPNTLIKEILRTFCKPNSNIFIPFLGSGQTILSAHELDMTAYGTELSKDFKDEYIIRIREEIKTQSQE